MIQADLSADLTAPGRALQIMVRGELGPT
jgi:hypothetical protein